MDHAAPTRFQGDPVHNPLYRPGELIDPSWTTLDPAWAPSPPSHKHFSEKAELGWSDRTPYLDGLGVTMSPTGFSVSSSDQDGDPTTRWNPSFSAYGGTGSVSFGPYDKEWNSGWSGTAGYNPNSQEFSTKLKMGLGWFGSTTGQLGYDAEDGLTKAGLSFAAGDHSFGYSYSPTKNKHSVSVGLPDKLGFSASHAYKDGVRTLSAGASTEVGSLDYEFGWANGEVHTGRGASVLGGLVGASSGEQHIHGRHDELSERFSVGDVDVPVGGHGYTEGFGWSNQLNALLTANQVGSATEQYRRFRVGGLAGHDVAPTSLDRSTLELSDQEVGEGTGFRRDGAFTMGYGDGGYRLGLGQTHTVGVHQDASVLRTQDGLLGQREDGLWWNSKQSSEWGASPIGTAAFGGAYLKDETDQTRWSTTRLEYATDDGVSDERLQGFLDFDHNRSLGAPTAMETLRGNSYERDIRSGLDVLGIPLVDEQQGPYLKMQSQSSHRREFGEHGTMNTFREQGSVQIGRDRPADSYAGAASDDLGRPGLAFGDRRVADDPSWARAVEGGPVWSGLQDRDAMILTQVALSHGDLDAIRQAYGATDWAPATHLWGDVLGLEGGAQAFESLSQTDQIDMVDALVDAVVTDGLDANLFEALPLIERIADPDVRAEQRARLLGRGKTVDLGSEYRQFAAQLDPSFRDRTSSVAQASEGSADLATAYHPGELVGMLDRKRWEYGEHDRMEVIEALALTGGTEAVIAGVLYNDIEPRDLIEEYGCFSPSILELVRQTAGTPWGDRLAAQVRRPLTFGFGMPDPVVDWLQDPEPEVASYEGARESTPAEDVQSALDALEDPDLLKDPERWAASEKICSNQVVAAFQGLDPIRWGDAAEVVRGSRFQGRVHHELRPILESELQDAIDEQDWVRADELRSVAGKMGLQVDSLPGVMTAVSDFLSPW